MKHLLSYNESIRDKMTAVPHEEVITKIKRMYPVTGFFTALEHGLLDLAKDIHKGNEHLIDVDRTDGLALETAVMEDNTEIVEYLLSLGANPNYDSGRMIRYPIENDNIEMVKLLLDNGYVLNKPDGYCDAIHVAIRDRKQPEMIEMLIDYGANISDKTYRAVMKTRPDYVKYMKNKNK